MIKKTANDEYMTSFTHNGEPIFWTEGYTSKADAKKAIESILKYGPGAEVDDQS